MSNKKILIIAPAWIGDLIISAAFIKALKNNQNNSIDILINSNLVNVAHLIPGLRNVIPSETEHGKLSLFYRIKMGFCLRSENYDECYILTNSYKSAIIPFVAMIKKRVSYLGEFRYGLINIIKKPVDRKLGMVNRYLNLIDQKYSSKVTPILNIRLKKELISSKFKFDGKYIVFCPDAEYGSAKRWPTNKWMNLATELSELYKIIIVGLDTSIGDEFKSLDSDKIINLIGRTNLVEVMEIIALSQGVVSNDSGLMHVSAAFDRKTVALYGSSSPTYTPPLISKQKREIIYKDLDCSPCFKRVCPLGHTKCLNDIKVDEVKKSATKLFQ
jgi:heptosyltransferase-2